MIASDDDAERIELDGESRHLGARARVAVSRADVDGDDDRIFIGCDAAFCPVCHPCLYEPTRGAKQHAI